MSPRTALAAAARGDLAYTLRSAAPGVLVAATIAMAATFLSEHYGGPVMLFALLLGMAFHFLSVEGRCVAGIDLAAKQILRIGVALLGARITAEQIMALGPTPVLTVIAGVALTLGLGVLIARILKLDRAVGVLTGGAVAICGASAALAIAAVLPRGANAERDTIFTVIGVTTLSTLAMILYPIIVGLFGLDHQAAGIFLGGTIHDVAQVVGAGYSVSQETGDIATFTKLMRVAMLVPVVVTLSLLFRPGEGVRPRGGLPLPWFLVVFAILVVVNSLHLIPSPAVVAANDVSRWCLVTAIAALGMKTSLKAMAQVGPKPVLLLVSETLFLALLVLGVVTYVY
ncbi:putative sulfate exporter family transporter [Inquilinus sp. CAU 1745]|uniref:YeiH family protein n=1 Tax=Inquilinus sp. CAU 1745 TaxID=3140369 RepID=UPI00325B479A